MAPAITVGRAKFATIHCREGVAPTSLTAMTPATTAPKITSALTRKRNRMLTSWTECAFRLRDRRHAMSFGVAGELIFGQRDELQTALWPARCCELLHQ